MTRKEDKKVKNNSNLIWRLRKYSQSVVAYKLDADFAAAVTEAADTLDQSGIEIENYRRNLGDCRSDLQDTEEKLSASEVARSDLGKRLALAQQERDVVHKRNIELEQAMVAVEKVHDALYDAVNESRPCCLCEKHTGEWNPACQNCLQSKNPFHPEFKLRKLGEK